MPNVVIHPRLKTILLLDAGTGIAVAALQLALPQFLNAWLGLAVPLLWGSAVLLLGYVALLIGMAFSSQIKRWVLQLLIWGNLAWAIACLALAFTLTSATTLGVGYLLVQTFTVLAFAALQWRMGRESHAASDTNQPAWARAS